MRLKIIWTFIIILIFLWINSNNIKNFYHNYIWEYNKTNNTEWSYNKATKEYIDWAYFKSIESFSWILDNENKEINFRKYHNLWNNYYKVSDNPPIWIFITWETKKEINNSIENFSKLLLAWNKNKIKILVYEKSIDSYNKALSYKLDEETAKNLEFVKDKLRILELEEKKKKQENKKAWEEKEKSWDNENSEGNKEWEEKSWDNKNTEGNKASEEEKKSWDNKNSEGNKEWEEKEKSWDDKNAEGNKEWEEEKKSWDNKNSEGNKEWEEKWLSKETKKILEQKLKELNKLQWNIWEFYNENYVDNEEDLEYLFDNTMFDNGLLNKNNEKKDW